MTDFIDRAKLEALAMDEFPAEHVGYDRLPPDNCGCDECYVRDAKRLAFLAGAAAHAALLDAETTEEWGVRDSLGVTAWPTETGARVTARNRTGRTLMSRRALYTPWLPSEGGEKP